MATASKSTSQLQRGENTRKKIKSFIQKYWLENNCAPTLAEIAKGVGLSTHNGVRTHLLIMQSKGEVEWQPGKFRTVRLTPPAA